MNKENRICFSDLSGWLKTIVVAGWIIGSLHALTFIIAFIQGYY